MLARTGSLLIRQVTCPNQVSRKRKLKSTLGELEMTVEQVFKLGAFLHGQLSLHARKFLSAFQRQCLLSELKQTSCAKSDFKTHTFKGLFR